MTTMDTVLATTLENSRKKLIIASMRSNALMAWLFTNKRTEKEAGGYNITNPLVVGRNPNVGTFSYYGTMPMAQTSEFDKIEYGWSRTFGNLIVSQQEIDENDSGLATIKLLKGKMEVLEISIQEKFSEWCYGAGIGDDPNGLTNLIPDDPTTGTLGTISRVAETQWRTSSYDFATSLDPTVIEEAFDDILMDLTLKGEKPTVILAGRDIYRTYRAAVRDKSIVSLGESSKAKGVVDLGFVGVSHQNIPIMYDEDCPVNKAYFINDTYLRAHILKDIYMKSQKLVAPWNVDAIGHRILSQFQICLWRAYRTHAVLIN